MPPTSRTTLKAIAQQLGVSTTTVSRAERAGSALSHRSGNGGPRPHAGRADGFSPNRFARGLRLAKTATIGLIVPDIANPFFGAIAHRIAVDTRRRGYSILLCDSQEDVLFERHSLDLLRNWQVEGVVVCPVGQTTDHLAEVLRAGLPLVQVDRYFPDLAAPYVGCDNAAGAHAATEHLLAKGHRRIACLQGLCGTTPNEQRLTGYRQALADGQIAADESLIVGDSFTEECGYRETSRLLAVRPDVTALLCFCNLSAPGAIRRWPRPAGRSPATCRSFRSTKTPMRPTWPPR